MSIKIPELLSKVRSRNYQRLRTSRTVRSAAFSLEIARAPRRLGAPMRDLRGMLSSFPEWQASIRDAASPIDLGIPWIVLSARDYLQEVVTADMRGFEFGTGGSTIFLRDLGVELHSVEHDPEWFDLMRERLADEDDDQSFIGLHPGEPIDEHGDEKFISDRPEYRGMSFRRYVTAIDRYPEGHFDLVMVDGRARNACIRHGMRRVRPGGLLVLDNSERSRYKTGIELMVGEGWQPLHFYGPIPSIVQFGRTSVFQRPIEFVG